MPTVSVDKQDENIEQQSFWSGKKLVLAGVGAVACAAYVGLFSFVTPALRRHVLPYVPATDNQVANVLALLRKHGRHQQSSRSIVDLGSGDGRVVFACADAGFSPCAGVELNTPLVYYSKLSAYRRRRASTEVAFHRKNLWKFDLRSFDNAIFFGTESKAMMIDLEKKFERELQANAHVVTCRYPLPSWRAIDSVQAENRVDSVWIYRAQSAKNSQ